MISTALALFDVAQINKNDFYKPDTDKIVISFSGQNTLD